MKTPDVMGFFLSAACLVLAAGIGLPQTVSRLDLSGIWKVTWNDGNHGFGWSPEEFAAFNPELDPLRYIDVPVPMDMNLAFQNLGFTEDLTFGMNTLKTRWVGQQVYQYCRTVDAPDDVRDADAWLTFERLDINAVVFLNGTRIGEHRNAFIPCRFPVKGVLKPGKNLLVVAVESGSYDVADRPGRDYNAAFTVLLNKRHWLRKPQYQFGWDWNPVLVNVGITGPVSLEWTKSAVRLDQIVPWIRMSDDLSSADLTVRAFIESSVDTGNATVEVGLEPSGRTERRTVALRKGLHAVPVGMRVEGPELWWPVGQGKQALYTMTVSVSSGGRMLDSASRRIGFRKIEVDRSPHPVEGNYFTVKVNNRPVFLKGGNWVPADMVYSNVGRKRLDALTDFALAANFNTLRIWGGGLFAGNELLSLCDEKGLVVWHDFLFACAEYPGDDVGFYHEVEREVRWAAREFAHHPSLIVWCGNNEMEWGVFGWGYTESGKVVPDYILFHHLIPVVLKEEDPFRFYWPSSPYSENHEFPNSKTTGDQHPWTDWGTMEGFDLHIYRGYVDRFPNEGGVLGASSPASIRQMLPADQRFVRSFAWEHHDNTLNLAAKDGEGLSYKTVRIWTGLDYRKLPLDDYLFASALLQAEGLTEYISNFRRRMTSSASAIFWMFNDSWPVSHGWTIVDYYLRRKLAFHPVRRANLPVTVVVADEGRDIVVYGINDGTAEWKGKVRYGLFETHGRMVLDESADANLPSNQSVRLASFDKAVFEQAGIRRHGAFAVLERDGAPVAQYRLFLAKFVDMEFDKPAISIKTDGDKAVFSSPFFVWGVCLDRDGESHVSDNCFDLYPGIPYGVRLNKGEKIRVVATGNDLFKR
jgi:beta-mannosidase